MNKALVIIAIITIALSAYALNTAKIPPASIEYREVFYIENQSITFVTKDGFGLFSMMIHPIVKEFTLILKFPEGTSYIIRYGNEIYRGSSEAKIHVTADNLPDEIYVQFQLPPEITKRVILEKGEARIIIKGDRMPVWHVEDVIYVRYRNEERS